ncbi:chromosome partitioning protein [Frankia sp. AgKG'84/4]
MRVVSVVNYKGGVGKTTLTANIGAEIARRGKRVLLVDLDPQASLTLSFYRPEQWRQTLQPSQTIKHWFESWRPRGKLRDPLELVATPARANFWIPGSGRLDIIASDLTLSEVEEDLVVAAHGAAGGRSGRDFLRVFGRLRDALSLIPAGEYDFVVIDCPPSFGMLTRSAVLASDFLVIPAKPDELSTVAIEHFVDRFAYFGSVYDGAAVRLRSADPQDRVSAVILGVVFTMVRFQGKAPILAEQIYIDRHHAGVPAFRGVVRENHSFYADAASESVPLVLSDRAPRLNVEEMRSLVTEIIGRIGDPHGD